MKVLLGVCLVLLGFYGFFEIVDSLRAPENLFVVLISFVALLLGTFLLSPTVSKLK